MKPKRFFTVFVAITVLVAVALGGGFVFWQRNLKTRVATLNKLTTDIKLENERLDHLEKLNKQLEDAKPITSKVDEVLPSTKEQSEATAQLAQIVTTAGMPFEGLTFETTRGLPAAYSQTTDIKASGSKVMTVRFNSNGSYAQLQEVLKNIENNLRHMQVQSITVSRGEGGNLAVNLTVDLYIKS